MTQTVRVAEAALDPGEVWLIGGLGREVARRNGIDQGSDRDDVPLLQFGVQRQRNPLPAVLTDEPILGLHIRDTEKLPGGVCVDGAAATQPVAFAGSFMIKLAAAISSSVSSYQERAIRVVAVRCRSIRLACSRLDALIASSAVSEMSRSSRCAAVSARMVAG